MKIKTDFVTNSSSTAFIVLIPNNYELSKDDFYDSYNSEKMNYKDPELSLKECKEIIEMLKNGENIYANDDGHGGVTHFIWGVILDILNNDGLLLNSLDISSDDPDIIIGVTQDDIDKIIFNYIDLNKIIKTCNRKGVENDKDIAKK